MPHEIIGEILDGTDKDDLLLEWMKINRNHFALDEDVDAALVQKVLDEGYAPDLKDDEIEQLGRDPFLIAYALAAAERTVVTTETPRPSKKRHNRKLPDVCDTFSVPWLDASKFIRVLNFSTAWKNNI
jgi:hypothetical protein